MSSLAGADVQALLTDAAGRAGRYLAGLDERPVAPDDAALAGLARFDEPLPEVAGDPAGTLALLPPRAARRAGRSRAGPPGGLGRALDVIRPGYGGCRRPPAPRTR